MIDIGKLISKKDAITLLEIIYACSKCAVLENAHEIINNINTLLNFEKAVYGLASVNKYGVVQHYDTINFSYPLEWLDIYREKKFVEKDPIVIENFSTFGLQYWAETYEKYVLDTEFIAMSHDFNLGNGYAWGTLNRSGTEGCLLSLAGEMKKNSRDIYVLTSLSPHLHTAFSNILHPQKDEKTLLELSAREKEVVRWVSHGKSNWDISMLLNISERTVKFHMDSIMKKLDAVNRSHAVAIALTSGVIS
jgi:LuxR family transcriptional regulator, quorum-sensing system regulator CviR